MSFLYPLFLLAGLSLAIPVLIHLFNLRRYKTVLFPHTRFLKNIQLNSRKQSQVRYKWLLAARLLFLASVILAFAQPYFNQGNKGDAGNRLKVIYIDNSYSMLVKNGARSLLEIAKDAARRQIKNSATASRFLLLTNDKPASYKSVPADKALTELNNIDASASDKNVEQVLSTVQSMMQGEVASGADVYYYSDYQISTFETKPDASLMKNIAFYGVPVQSTELQNVYIDTAYLNSPVLQTGQPNQLIVRSRALGKLPKDAPVLQLSVNGQVKSAATLNFSAKNESTDTLNFQVNTANWQQMTLSINDAAVKFDDSFRITARSTPALSVLVLNEGQPNPFIQAAFRAYNGFRLNQTDVNAMPADWKDYNLVILNGVTHIDDALAKMLNTAMVQGQSVCIFPGKTGNPSSLNDGLKQLGDIQVKGIDTAVQAASTLQQGSSLVKDIFERIPANVQLPVANWHYVITAGLGANQQSILSFRNGDPFFAKYTPAKGQLYICATAADLASGNFPGSYFFVPFIYQMAIQSRGGDVYAVTAGRQQAVYLPMRNADERNMIHLYGPGVDAIPPQRPDGAGLDVFIDRSVQQPGFYRLAANGADTTEVALNADRKESQLEAWDIAALKDNWKNPNVHWISLSATGSAGAAGAWGNFPLWKVCVILALIMLAVETYLLAGGIKRQSLATPQ
ncbi:MAG: BatA domain-containing protein [Bacteroidetes bacterium]|nr:BatA domain-containing protein [Bacteroidota bacterium]